MKRLLQFIETPLFSKQITQMLDDDSYSKFQTYLCNNPEVGDIITGTGGVRKVRWSLPNTGKSSGVRILYYYLTDFGTVYLMMVYAKSDQINISDSDKQRLKQVITTIKQVHDNGQK